MTDTNAPDLYDVLGVRPTATDTELDHAFRMLARRPHPDADPDDRGNAFQRVLAAYAVLRDPLARRDYDRRLTAAHVNRAVVGVPPR